MGLKIELYANCPLTHPTKPETRRVKVEVSKGRVDQTSGSKVQFFFERGVSTASFSIRELKAAVKAIEDIS